MIALAGEGSIMQDDNPLWYDYVEPDEAPSPALLASANLVNVALNAARAIVRVYMLPDRVWCRAADLLARHQMTRARRP